MRVVLYRSHTCNGGITSWMLLHGRQLLRRGLDCTFWFAKNQSTRLPEFEQLGPVVLKSGRELLQALEQRTFDVVHVVNQDLSASAPA